MLNVAEIETAISAFGDGELLVVGGAALYRLYELRG